MKTYRLKAQILFPLTLAMSLLLGTFVLSAYWSQQHHINDLLEGKLRSVERLFNAELEADAGMMWAALEVILNDQQLKAAFKAKDREALLDRILSSFWEENAWYRISQFCFTAPDRTLVACVHEPEMHGNKINRFTTLQAERTGRPAYGIELEPSGLFTLRVVVPWYEGRQVIGYLDLGEEIHHITRGLHDILGLEFYILIDKKHLDRKTWEAAGKGSDRGPEWDRFPSTVIIDQTIDVFPESLSALVHKSHIAPWFDTANVSLGGRNYRARFIHLKEASGRTVGDLLVMTDCTVLLAELHKTVMLVSAISIGIGGVLFILFYVFVGRMEQRMDKANEKLAWTNKAVENASDAIIMLDRSGNTIYQNRAFRRLFGYSIEELNGLGSAPVLYSDKAFARELFHTLKTGIAWHGEVEVTTRGGQTVPVSLRVDVIKEDAGEILGFIGIHTDITERRRAEIKRKELEARLQQAQKIQAIGTLAGGIAHDFNNLLFPIMGYAEILLADEPKDSSIVQGLGQILNAAHRAKDLVKQILTFSRQGEQQRMPLKVQPIIRESLKLLRATLPTTIEIRQQIDANCGFIMGDPIQIHQIMMNLCTNAYHAMREQGGVLKVELNEVDSDSIPSTPPNDLAPGRYVNITVNDTGVGMDRSVMERIFEPYFTTKAQGEGTGMGLSVVLGIATSYGGEVAVRSEPGKGSTFNVYLPRVEAPVRPPEAQLAESIPVGTERILVVDDQAFVVNMVQKLLERLGYDVTARTSSVEALEAFRAQPDQFDLVITDQTMPNMTGAELSRKLMQIRPDIPIILCTGFSEVISEEKARAMGIKGFIMKPVLQGEMAKAIRKALDH